MSNDHLPPVLRDILNSFTRVNAEPEPPFVAQQREGSAGPWVPAVSEYDHKLHYTVNQRDNPQKIVALCGLAGMADEDESIANTIAIAAMPDLLAALRPFAALLQSHHDHRDDGEHVFGINGVTFTVGDLRRAAAAIAKADGRE